MTAGKTARPTLKLVAGQKITFRLKESPATRIPGFPWIGYRLTKLDGKTPVLEDDQGPYTGDVLSVYGDPVREASLRVPTGTYRLTAVLRSDMDRGYSLSQKNLWSMERNVKVVAGKDIVIEMVPK